MDFSPAREWSSVKQRLSRRSMSEEWNEAREITEKNG